jgi:ATP-dependent RNA helicase SUPV3L1/SUV3
VCGERAVRVDILERLADLIRPALSWRESTPGPKPDGAFDGRSFVVIGAMTSLTGASGEDFSSILRSLGYRMDRRPKPAATPAVEIQTAAETEADKGTPVEATPPDGQTALPTQSSIALLPQAEFIAQAGEAPGAEPAPAKAAAMATEVAAETPAEPAPGLAVDIAQTVAVEAAPTGTAGSETAAEEPAFIEVWRPAGLSDRRTRRPRRPPRFQQAAQAAAPTEGGEAVPAAPSGVVAPAEGAEPSDRPRRHDRPDRPDRQVRRNRHDRQQHADRQQQRGERQGDRQDRGPRRDRPRRKRDDGPDRAEREQYYAKPYGGGGERRNKQPDPNSPFAKLAALKQQLEQNGKEPS